MRGRNWAIVIVVNVVISAAVVIAILLASGQLSAPPAPTQVTTVPARATMMTPDSETAPAPLSSATPEPNVTAQASRAPLVYTVEQGDTLSAIAEAFGVSIEELAELNQLADPNLLRVGQELLIPAGSTQPPTPAATLLNPTDPPADAQPLPDAVGTVLPTPTSSGAPLVEIRQVLGSAALADEMVVISNRGGAVSLEAWTLSDGEGSSFTFPAVILYTDAEVRLHSRSGTHQPADLYWGLVEPAWRGGELITLRDATGEVVDTYIVP